MTTSVDSYRQPGSPVSPFRGFDVPFVPSPEPRPKSPTSPFRGFEHQEQLQPPEPVTKVFPLDFIPWSAVAQSFPDSTGNEVDQGNNSFGQRERGDVGCLGFLPTALCPSP